MWVRKQIDIGFADIGYGILQSCSITNRSKVQMRVEAAWPDNGSALACLSVRSGFELLLGALNLPAGSEVLISSVTIRDMVRLIEEHQLIPVPVDVDVDTVSPKIETLSNSINKSTRAIVVTHLFGSRVPLDPILEIARRHQLLVIEDCAQAYVGPEFVGHPGSDVTMFSFGAIKTATTLGGAILGVRDSELRTRMRREQETWPVQARRAYIRRLGKYALLKLISIPSILSVVIRFIKIIGSDYDRFANQTARGFPGPKLREQIRLQPPSALLSLLERRLEHFDASAINRRIQAGRHLADSLRGRVRMFGEKAQSHSFWVFPVIVKDPPSVISALSKQGFDATQGASMWVVDPPKHRADTEPRDARAAVANTVYLPFYPQMPLKVIERMAEALIDAIGKKS